jgi:hypothetical protein
VRALGQFDVIVAVSGGFYDDACEKIALDLSRVLDQPVSGEMIASEIKSAVGARNLHRIDQRRECHPSSCRLGCKRIWVSRRAASTSDTP